MGQRQSAHAGEEDDGQADGLPAEALHDAARAVDEAPRSAHIARQHHLCAHLQVHHRPALRRPCGGINPPESSSGECISVMPTTQLNLHTDAAARTRRQGTCAALCMQYCCTQGSSVRRLHTQPWCAAVQETASPRCEDCRCGATDLARLQGFSAPGVLRPEAHGLARQLPQARRVDRLHVLAVRVQLHATHIACRRLTRERQCPTSSQCASCGSGLTQACRHLTDTQGVTGASFHVPKQKQGQSCEGSFPRKASAALSEVI